jgi:carbonic anhydrase/acetyltransferase-like protein (isoleucine patch superfamily)
MSPNLESPTFFACTEHIDMAIYQLGEDRPRIHPSAWVAGSADVVGRVELGEHASVWYGSVLRGDNEWITIGPRSNVQDGCMLHTDMGFPLVLGPNVTVGHHVMLHGCTVGEGTLIGIKSVLLNGARIGKHCIVGAGSLVTEGKEFPDGCLIVGSPAKLVRMLTPEQIERVAMAATHYVDNAVRHRDSVKRVD